MEHHAYSLREIADAMGLKPVRQLARLPGVKAVYRVTVRYPDSQARSSVATLRRSLTDGTVLEVVYQRLFDHKPLVHAIAPARYEAFALALQKIGFDRLRDQPDVPFYGATLWLVERAAGSFVKSVIIAPQTATQAYAVVVDALQKYLPEALRQVK
jgi:hypothetical protein